jgi:hypothetical protein
VLTRKKNRYPLALPVSFYWKDDDQTQHHGVGVTREVDIRGAFISSRSVPPLHAHVKLQVFLPPSRRTIYPVQLFGEGLVVCVNAVPDGKGPGALAVEGSPFVLPRTLGDPVAIESRLKSSVPRRETLSASASCG